MPSSLRSGRDDRLDTSRSLLIASSQSRTRRTTVRSSRTYKAGLTTTPKTNNENDSAKVRLKGRGVGEYEALLPSSEPFVSGSHVSGLHPQKLIPKLEKWVRSFLQRELAVQYHNDMLLVGRPRLSAYIKMRPRFVISWHGPTVMNALVKEAKAGGRYESDSIRPRPYVLRPETPVHNTMYAVAKRFDIRLRDVQDAVGWVTFGRQPPKYKTLVEGDQWDQLAWLIARDRRTLQQEWVFEGKHQAELRAVVGAAISRVEMQLGERLRTANEAEESLAVKNQMSKWCGIQAQEDVDSEAEMSIGSIKELPEDPFADPPEEDAEDEALLS